MDICDWVSEVVVVVVLVCLSETADEIDLVSDMLSL